MKGTNLSIGQKCIHPFQEAGVQHVRLIQYKNDLLSLAARATKDCSQVLIKIFSSILPVHLNQRQQPQWSLHTRALSVMSHQRFGMGQSPEQKSPWSVGWGKK